MIKNKIILLMISLSLFMPSTIYADCTKEEIDNFKKIEDEYKVTYEFDKDSKTYTVYLTNPNTSKYTFSGSIFDESNSVSLTEDKKTKIEKVKAGNYNVKILIANDTCEVVLKEISLELPKYNQYYNDPLCEGIEEFVLCQQTYNKDIDRETFISRVEAYKKSKKEKEEKENNSKNKEEKKDNEILKYVEENWFKIAIIVVFIIMVIITIILTAKSIRKSRRLE